MKTDMLIPSEMFELFQKRGVTPVRESTLSRHQPQGLHHRQLARQKRHDQSRGPATAGKAAVRGGRFCPRVLAREDQMFDFRRKRSPDRNGSARL